jgi:hypothetical protein
MAAAMAAPATTIKVEPNFPKLRIATPEMYDAVRALIGDTQIPGGEVAFDHALRPLFEHAIAINPEAHHRRIIVAVALYFCDAHGWTAMSDRMRDNVRLGLL